MSAPSFAARAAALALACAGLAATALPASAATAPVAPSAPSVAHLNGAATVRWTDNATDETGFVVERCFGSGCTTFGQIGVVGADVTSFVDAFDTAGTNRYRVRAVNAAGSSAPSDVAELLLFSTGEVFARMTASVTAGTAPLTVTFDGSTSSGLNGPIAAYAWSFGDGGTAAGAVVTHTFTTPGTYAASLEVTGSVFPGTNATAVNVSVSAPPLAAPSNLAATSPTRSRVALTWTNPASAATSLAVERCSGSTCTRFTRIASVGTSAVTYTDATVRRGTTYRYRLAASDGTATVWSNVVTITSR